MQRRLLADADFFRSRISKIDGSGDLGDHIVKVVQAKTVLNTVLPPRPSAEVPIIVKPAEEEKVPVEQNGTKDATSGEVKKQDDVRA